MIQHMVEKIGGIANYGMISICLFFVVFTCALVWAFRLKGKFLSTMGSLPLEDETEAPAAKGEAHHE